MGRHLVVVLVIGTVLGWASAATATLCPVNQLGQYDCWEGHRAPNLEAVDYTTRQAGISVELSQNVINQALALQPFPLTIESGPPLPGITLTVYRPYVTLDNDSFKALVTIRMQYGNQVDVTRTYNWAIGIPTGTVSGSVLLARLRTLAGIALYLWAAIPPEIRDYLPAEFREGVEKALREVYFIVDWDRVLAAVNEAVVPGYVDTRITDLQLTSYGAGAGRLRIGLAATVKSRAQLFTMNFYKTQPWHYVSRFRSNVRAHLRSIRVYDSVGHELYGWAGDRAPTPFSALDRWGNPTNGWEVFSDEIGNQGNGAKFMMVEFLDPEQSTAYGGTPYFRNFAYMWLGQDPPHWESCDMAGSSDDSQNGRE